MGQNAISVINGEVPDMGDDAGARSGTPTTPLLTTVQAAGDAVQDGASASQVPTERIPVTDSTPGAVPDGAIASGDAPGDTGRDAAVQDSPAAGSPVAPPPARGWRALDNGPQAKPWRVLSVVLLVLGCVLAPLGVTAAWAKNLASSQDAYMEAVGPLISDPVIINAAENKIVGGIDTAITNLNLSDKVGQELQSLGLPPRVASLATTYLATFRSDITNAITKLVDQVLSSPKLVTVWNEANIKAHSIFVQIMQGQNPTRLSSINLDLSSAVSEVKQKLSGAGVQWASQIPDVPIVFNLTGNADVQQISGYYDTLLTLGTWLPIIAIVLLLLSIVLAPSRLRGLSRAGGWLAVSMLVLVVALIAGREYAISQVPAQPDVTQAFTRQLTVNLQNTIRIVLVVGAVIAVLAWMFGRSRSAGAVRTAIRRLTGGVQDARWQWVIRIAAGAVAVVLAVVLVSLDNPKLVQALLLAIGVGLFALIALGPRRRGVEPPAADRTQEAVESNA